MKLSKKLCSLLLIANVLSILSCNNNAKDTIEIKTKSATYFYDPEAGGFFSMIDNEGNDWINFKYDKEAKFPKGAESMFRGLPNLVYKGKNDGVGHPGFKQCKSELINDSTILTRSKDRKWEYTVTFSDTHVLFDIKKIDPKKKFWFLYEGIPNGKWNPKNYFWGTSDSGGYNIPDYYAKEFSTGKWEWAYFGTKGKPTVVYLAHLNSDQLPDMCGFLGNSPNGLDSQDGMVVFGFGRENFPNHKAHLNSEEKFIIGFLNLDELNDSAYYNISNKINSVLDLYQ